MNTLTLIIIGYFIGNINPAHIIGYFKKTNISKTGSKNPGASNITMTFGWKYGIITGIVDILKSFIPVLTVKLLGYDQIDQLIIGTAVIIGHVYPILYKFKGGKGTASLIGLIAGMNIYAGLILSATLILGTIITDFMALGTLVLLIGYVTYNIIYFSGNYLLISFIIPILSIYKHFPNFIRIAKGEEKGLRSTFK